MITVNVTDSDIRKGEKLSSFCPIALSFRRMGYDGIKVGNWHAYYGDKYGLHTMVLPKEAVSFILAFDNQKEVEPFQFNGVFHTSGRRNGADNQAKG